jgi:molecular chaperone GrpE
MSEDKKEPTSRKRKRRSRLRRSPERKRPPRRRIKRKKANALRKNPAARKRNIRKSTKRKSPRRSPKKAEQKKSGPSPEEQLRDANDKYLRLLAEYDNFRKRSQKERDSIYGDVKADTVTKFLPVYDNLVRALDQSTEDEAYRRGVEMIMTQFDETLSKLGVTEIESVGKKFDPNLHNAVMHVEDETKGENEIVEVFQKGFKLGDKIIRFAMVKVAN